MLGLISKTIRHNKICFQHKYSTGLENRCEATELQNGTLNIVIRMRIIFNSSNVKRIFQNLKDYLNPPNKINKNIPNASRPNRISNFASTTHQFNLFISKRFKIISKKKVRHFKCRLI